MISILKIIYYTVGILLYGGIVIGGAIYCIENRDLFKKEKA